jgi:hypothetical protein
VTTHPPVTSDLVLVTGLGGGGGGR